MAYVCLECGNSFDLSYLKSVNGTFICPIRNCTGTLCDVDDTILPIVLDLQKKGFIVLDSCSGHVSNDFSQNIETYLRLSRYVKGLYLSGNDLNKLFGNIDNDCDICYNSDEIFVKIASQEMTPVEALKKIVDNCVYLLNWCVTDVQVFVEYLDSSWCEGEEVCEDFDGGITEYEEDVGCIDN